MIPERWFRTYEQILRYTLVPSAFIILALLLLIDFLDMWTIPHLFYYLLVAHYGVGFLYALLGLPSSTEVE